LEGNGKGEGVRLIAWTLWFAALLLAGALESVPCVCGCLVFLLFPKDLQACNKIVIYSRDNIRMIWTGKNAVNGGEL
jgi:hypothetical protein